MATVQALLNEFRTWLPHEYLRTVNRTLEGCTPTEMHNAIDDWLRRYLEHVKTHTK